MSKWIAEFELEDGDTMPEHMDLNYMGAKIDFHCRPMWIPVSERLPEEGQWVMVTFDGKIAVCIAHDNDGTLREATSLVLKNATEIWLYPESEWGDGYAAWMPLPEPYKGKEEEE